MMIWTAIISQYFADFAPNRPYISLILSRVTDQLVVSGRIFLDGKWLTLEHTAAEREIVEHWPKRTYKRPPSYEVDRVCSIYERVWRKSIFQASRRVASLLSVLGELAQLLSRFLARAGIGRLVIVDPDVVECSNLERIHGSVPEHAKKRTPKVVVARELVHQIDPSIEVVALQAGYLSLK